MAKDERLDSFLEKLLLGSTGVAIATLLAMTNVATDQFDEHLRSAVGLAAAAAAIGASTWVILQRKGDEDAGFFSKFRDVYLKLASSAAGLFMAFAIAAILGHFHIEEWVGIAVGLAFFLPISVSTFLEEILDFLD
ncbi:hypothetical protein [Paraburkholderia flagellata]|uniref:hypothetical protein n=1 Tax=Paraburkholderia flagellata TaxID=2883241 RepID=UPI001F30D7A3|nr:hypothetical protein [Paraburkholderia flagellata]